MTTTVISSKGQIVLPSHIRKSLRWTEGVELTVEQTPEGVLLRPVNPFAPRTVDEVFGMGTYRGKAKSLEDMNRAVRAEAKRRK